MYGFALFVHPKQLNRQTYLKLIPRLNGEIKSFVSYEFASINETFNEDVFFYLYVMLFL